jgi:hypothetical protein
MYNRPRRAECSISGMRRATLLFIALILSLTGGFHYRGVSLAIAQNSPGSEPPPAGATGANPCGPGGHFTDGPYARCDCSHPEMPCPVICWFSNSAQKVLCYPRQDIFLAPGRNPLPTCTSSNPSPQSLMNVAGCIQASSVASSTPLQGGVSEASSPVMSSDESGTPEPVSPLPGAISETGPSETGPSDASSTPDDTPVQPPAPLPPRGSPIRGVTVLGDPTFTTSVAHCFDLYLATPGELSGLTWSLQSALQTDGPNLRTITIAQSVLPGISSTHDQSAPTYNGFTRTDPANPNRSIAGPGASARIDISSNYSPATPNSILQTDEHYARPLTSDEIALAQEQYPNGVLETLDALATGFCIALIHEIGHAYDMLIGMDSTNPLGGGAIAIPNPLNPPSAGETPNSNPENYITADEERAVYWENAYRIFHQPYRLRTTYSTYPLPSGTTNLSP